MHSVVTCANVHRFAGLLITTNHKNEIVLRDLRLSNLFLKCALGIVININEAIER